MKPIADQVCKACGYSFKEHKFNDIQMCAFISEVFNLQKEYGKLV